MRHMISLASLDQTDFQRLIEDACEQARHPRRSLDVLAGRSVGLEFRKTSTRTRTSFAVAAARLGAYPIIYGPNDLQTNTGETIGDTVMVLSRYLDVLVMRTATDHAELQELAALDLVPIVNAMSATEHPTQALSDLAMLRRRYASLAGLRLLYTGEGNNTAVALAYAISRTRGMQGEFRTPEGYGLPKEVLETAAKLGARYGGRVSQSHVPPDARTTEPADIIYTTRWQTTGTSKPDPDWRRKFEPFAVRAPLVDYMSKSREAVIMHDLPAVRGEDCDGEILDGPLSICFDQAEQKLYTAMAVLRWCAGA